MRKKILVIDDSPTLLKFITKHLSAHVENYEVITTLNGGAGLESAQRETPDLILLDFMLPDMNGEGVCEQLAADPRTASIPVVLMSSSAPDITRTESRFDLVKKSMVKPFTPELLIATVGHIFKATPAKSSGTVPSAPPPAAAPAFSGDTVCFPLLDVLLAPAKKSLSGTLSFHFDKRSVELYFKEGALLLATTRDVDFYLHNTPMEIPPEQQDLFEELKQVQRESGAPVFLQMIGRDLAPADEAQATLAQFGPQLLAPVWAGSPTYFAFSESDSLPEFLNMLTSTPLPMLAWAFDSLRSAAPDDAALDLADGCGIPAYTRHGYERIQQLNLTEAEVAFATHAGTGSATFNDIATLAQLDAPAARQILYRFSVFHIFDYWNQSA